MTTIMAVKVEEPKQAVVFGSDTQASYKTPVEKQDMILFEDKKTHLRKITQAQDDSLIMSMTGRVTVQYEEFLKAIERKKPATEAEAGKEKVLPYLEFIEELKKGNSPIVRNYNLGAMLQGTHIDPSNSFNLAVVHRTPSDVNLYRVTEIGHVETSSPLILGTGAKEARSAYNFLTTVSNVIPEQYKTNLSITAYIVFKSLEAAINNDNHSSGIDLIVVTEQGIENLTKKIQDKTQKHFNKVVSTVLSDLDNL